MKKVSLDIWIQLLGMISIVASLIFVGLEMRQSQRIAIAGQQQSRAAITNSFVSTFLETGLDFQSIYFKRDIKQSLSVEDTAFRNAMHVMWFIRR